MIAGGWDAAKDAIPGLFKGKLDIHFLMLAVAVGASLIGAYGEAALLLFLFSLAGALEHFAMHRTRREINALFRLAPKTANRRHPGTGEEEAVPIEAIMPGDCLILRPGDTVPVDATVTEGSSATDEASLTGEAHPVEKTVGAEVRSGTQNLWGTLVVRCTRPARESALQQIIRLIQDARGQRVPSQRFIDRFGPVYTKGVLAATVLLFFVWWGLFGLPPFINETTAEGVTYSAFDEWHRELFLGFLPWCRARAIRRRLAILENRRLLASAGADEPVSPNFLRTNTPPRFRVSV